MAMKRKSKRKAAMKPLVTNPFEAAKRKKSVRHNRCNQNKTVKDKQSMPPPPPKTKTVVNQTNTFFSALPFFTQTQDGSSSTNNNLEHEDSNQSNQSQRSESYNWLQYKTMDNSQSIDYLTPMDNNRNNMQCSPMDIMNNRIFNHTKSKINNNLEQKEHDNHHINQNEDKKEYIHRKDLKIPLNNEYLDANERIDLLSYSKEQKGIVLGERYHIYYQEIKVLGNGSFGKVYKVRNRDDGCFYAIKKIKMQSIHNNTQYITRKYMKEGMVLSSLQRNGNICSNIILYNNMWIQNSYFYLVTEYCDNGNLYNLVDLNEDIFCKLIENISNALQFIHDNAFVHFDVKPENILISKDLIFKLADFGLCTKIIINNNNKENIPKFDEGDSRYLSRELIEESYIISELDKIDIFALGLSIYEMIIGDNLPSNGFKWQQIRNGNLSWIKAKVSVTNNMKQLIYAMVHSNPNERPSSKQLNIFLRKFNDKLLQEKDNQIQNLNKKIKILMHKIQHLT